MRGIRDVTLVQELGQPSLTIKIDRAKIARYGLNVADINGLIQTAIGGDVATQVVQEEKQFDLVVRLEQQYRDNPEEIGNILVATPGGQQIPLKEFADIQVTNGASFIYRQDNSRYIGVQFSVEGRDLAGAVDDAMQQVNAKVALPQGYRLDWGGEYTEYTASRQQLNVILPLTLFLIFLLLFALYSNFKFPFITVLGVLLSAPVGGIVALWITGTPFSVSSGIGFLALFGVSVQTAVVYISYVNELRRDGTPLDRGHPRRRDPAAAPDHDDRAGGGAGLAAGGAGHRRRHRFPAAVCAGHRQRPVHAAADQHLSDAGALCPGGAPGRSAGSVIPRGALRTESLEGGAPASLLGEIRQEHRRGPEISAVRLRNRSGRPRNGAPGYAEHEILACRHQREIPGFEHDPIASAGKRHGGVDGKCKGGLARSARHRQRFVQTRHSCAHPRQRFRDDEIQVDARSVDELALGGERAVEFRHLADCAQRPHRAVREAQLDPTAFQQDHLALVAREIRKRTGDIDARHTHAPSERIAVGGHAHRLMSDTAAVFPRHGLEGGLSNDLHVRR